MQNKLSMDEEDAVFYERFSHELRTLLTSMIGFSEYIEHSVTDPMVKFAAQVIYQGGHDVQRITSAYLDCLRLASPSGQLQLSQFSVVDVVQDTVLQAREFAQLREVKLVVNADDAAWSARMVSDRSVFCQIVALTLYDTLAKCVKDDWIQIDVCCEARKGQCKLSLSRQASTSVSFQPARGANVYADLAQRLATHLCGQSEAEVDMSHTAGMVLVFPLQVPQNVR